MDSFQSKEEYPNLSVELEKLGEAHGNLYRDIIDLLAQFTTTAAILELSGDKPVEPKLVVDQMSTSVRWFLTQMKDHFPDKHCKEDLLTTSSAAIKDFKLRKHKAAYSN